MENAARRQVGQATSGRAELNRRQVLLFLSLALTRSPASGSRLLAAAERDELRFDFSGPRMSKRGGRVTWPDPWDVWSALRGQASLQIEDGPAEIGRVAHFRTVDGSIVLYRDLRSRPADIRSRPWLSWRWTAEKLPAGGSVFRADRNDQVLQVYLAFRRSDGYDILGYVWDTVTDERAENVSRQSFRVLIFGRIEAAVHVVRKGPTDAWLTEVRNVAEDHRKYFSPLRPTLAAVGIWSDSNHTGSASDGKIGPLVFSASKPQDRLTTATAPS
ncbi:MAG: DUF3047 domain-containing protein [Thermogutta sp.]|nr:DUF3047 domain-containing protein [Thermogutta sp.]